MGFSQELADFSQGFSSGFQMVRSREEREAEKLANERRRQEVEQFNYEKSRRPVLEGREQKLYDLDVQRQEGAIDQQTYEKSRRAIEAGHEDTLFELGAEREKGVLEQQGYERGRRPVLEGREQKLFDLDVQRQEGAIDQQEYDKSRRAIEAGQSDTLFELGAERERGTLETQKHERERRPVKERTEDAVAEAERLKAEVAAEKSKIQLDVYDGYKKRLGKKRGPIKDEDYVPPVAPTPGPTSSIEPAVPTETPVSSMSTTEAVEPDAGTGAPVKAARPLVQVAGLYIGDEPPPEEAVPAEPAVPTTPATPAYGVPLPEAGPRAHPHVDRIQRSRTEIDLTAPQPKLDDATVNVLEAAGAQTNTRAVITSGGTGGEPAQVRLYDVETNQPLDPNNPDDRQRMEDFNAAVQSAPSEITSPLERTGSVYKVAREASMVGLDRAADKLGVKDQAAVDTPEYEQAARSFLLGEYGADVDQVEQAKAVVQEIAAEAGHELNEAEEAIHTIAYAYDSYMAMGLNEEAKEAAAALVGHYTTLAGQFSAVAKAAVMDGDLPAAIEAAARAYANVPDGVGVDFNQTRDGRYEVVMTNEETGEVTTRSIMTPQEIGGMIMKIDPSHFLSTISQAAGKDLAETLSAEAAEQMGKPEWEGIPMTQVPAMQAQERINLRGGGAVEVTDESGDVSVRAGGKGEGGIKQSDRAGVVEEVTQAFTDYAANAAAKNPETDAYTTQLTPEANSDKMAYIRPIAEQVAMDNADTMRPYLAAEAVIRMVDQEPAAVKPAKGGGFEVKLKGMDPFTISEGLYERLTDARIKYGPQSDATEPAFRQGRDTDRAMGQLPMLPDYDPTRGGARIVDRLRTVRRPSEAGPELGPGEAVPTRPVPRRPIVQSNPAVGAPVEIPSWFPLHESVVP